MQTDRSATLAFGGLAAMAAALGIGRFVYTPILPVMLTALGWSKSDAGLVASANFLGYLAGAMLASLSFAARAAEMVAAVSARRQFGIDGRDGAAVGHSVLCRTSFHRRGCERLRDRLRLDACAGADRNFRTSCVVWNSFCGVGLGILVSALAVSAMVLWGVDWKHLWIGSGVLAALATVVTALLIPETQSTAARQEAAEIKASPPGIGAMILAYGLFGFGYVITATFLIAIVRLSANLHVLEPWVWILFGLAAIPSVSLWNWLGRQIGIFNAFALACALEALGVAASVEWVTISGLCAATLLLGGTFMGITALGFVAGRTLSAGNPQQALGRMTASFSLGQIAGPAGRRIFYRSGWAIFAWHR